MFAQKKTHSRMVKIEIKGSLEDLKRISIFLDNNFIKHQVVEDLEGRQLEELAEAIDWPLEVV